MVVTLIILVITVVIFLSAIALKYYVSTLALSKIMLERGIILIDIELKQACRYVVKRLFGFN